MLLISLTFFDIPNQKSVIQKFPFAVPIHIPHPVLATKNTNILIDYKMSTYAHSQLFKIKS